MPLTQGQTFNERYWIAGLIERGGFGAVYKAWDITLDRPVAIKESYEDSPEGQRQFQLEAKLLARLAHPHLPRVIDYFILPGQGQYLVMEFVDGQTLEELRILAGGSLPEATALGWIVQVLDALSYIHSQEPPVIHRDIKPANIKRTPPDKSHPQGSVMLVDFGVAKAYDPHKRTTMGARAVTPGFSPHEQYGQAGTNTDARTDIYALGATLYMLLTGQEPPESVSRLLRDPLVPPRQLNPALSAQIEAVMLKAMHNDPDLRFQSAGELQAALSGLLTSVPPQPPPVPIQAPVIPTSPSVAHLQPVTPQPQPVPPASPATQPERLSTEEILTMVDRGEISSEVAIRLMKGEKLPEKAQRREAPPAPLVARVFAGLEFMPVPRGKFLMGSRQDNSLAYDNEKPQHTVEIGQDYWLARYPVTNQQYEKFVKATNQKHQWVYGWKKKLDHPVVNVSWRAAMAFCAWLNQTCAAQLPQGYVFRLPTEVEWEKAARGEFGAEWPWGNDFDPAKCNTYEGKKGGTTPVGAHSPQGDSPYGCANMVGNVWEWTHSLYQPYPYKADDGRENPKSEAARVLRGGSFSDDPGLARCACRDGDDPLSWYLDLGFRVGVVSPISISGL